MIEVRYRDRLGNNLFQYCMGRILAEELGFELKCEPIQGFPNTAEVVRGRRFDEPTETFDRHAIPFWKILQDKTPRHIVLDGWFQRAEYYKPYRDRIRHWFELPNTERENRAQHDLVVHVRRTDYVTLGWAMPFSYYQSAIERVYRPGMIVNIATDDPNDPFFRHFKRWNPEYINGNLTDHFAAMRDAKNLIMSPSSFSWWAAFLANDQRTICPLPDNGLWSKKRGEERGNMLVDFDLFECLPTAGIYQPSFRELFHQKKFNLVNRLLLSKCLV